MLRGQGYGALLEERMAPTNINDMLVQLMACAEVTSRFNHIAAIPDDVMGPIKLPENSINLLFQDSVGLCGRIRCVLGRGAVRLSMVNGSNLRITSLGDNLLSHANGESIHPELLDNAGITANSPSTALCTLSHADGAEPEVLQTAVGGQMLQNLALIRSTSLEQTAIDYEMQYRYLYTRITETDQLQDSVDREIATLLDSMPDSDFNPPPHAVT
jgi:hypothetical protein